MVSAVEEDSFGNLGRLNRVVSRTAPTVDALDSDEFDTKVLGFLDRTWERHQHAVIEGVIRVGDQVFMPAAIVPTEGERSEAARPLAQIENGLELIKLLFVVLVILVEA